MSDQVIQEQLNSSERTGEGGKDQDECGGCEADPTSEATVR